MAILDNLQHQLFALENFFAVWPLFAEMVKDGDMVIHKLDPNDTEPSVSFVHEKDVWLAQVLLRGPWLADLIEEAGRYYVRHAQLVLGVEVVIRIQAPTERKHHLTTEVAA